MTYKAFISYSHAADGRLAPALQSALHRFAKPWYRLRAIRVFRDKTTLAATPALWPSIEKALGESEYFLLLASPEAAASPWVQREIAYWIERRPEARDKLLIILTGGGLVWDARANDFDWTQTDALPRILEKRFAQEPLFLDLRWARKEEQLSPRHPEFRDAIATLAATLHNRPKDEISGEEVRQYKIARRLAWLGVSALAVLTILASGLGYFANDRRMEAERQQQIAVARQLAAQGALANVQQADLLAQSVLLGIEAVRRFPSLDTEQGLRERVALLAKPLRELRADGMVMALAFSPDGKRIAAGGGYSARVWETASGQGIARLGHDSIVEAIVFSPDGRHLATGSWDQTARIWDLSSGAEVARFAHEDQVRAVVFSPDGKSLATTIGGTRSPRTNCAWRWDLASARQVVRVCHDDRSAVVAVAFAPDGLHFATASWDRTVRLWETATGREVMRFAHDAAVQAIAFDGKGTLLVSGSRDGQVRAWDLRARKQRAVLTMSHQAAVNAVSVSPDDQLFVTGSDDHTARVWDAKDGREISRMVLDDNVTGVSFSPDGREVLTVAGGTRAARVWNAASGEESARTVHEASVGHAVFSPDGRFLASGGGHIRMQGDSRELVQPAVLLWDRATGRTISRIAHRESIDELAFSPDGRYLATASWDRTARISDPATGEERFRIRHDDKVASLAFSGDGRWVATGSTNSLRLLDLRDGRETALPGATGLVRALAFSPDGTRLAAGSVDGTTRVWDLATGQQRFQRRDGDTVPYIAYSADGRRLLTTHGNVASLLNADDGGSLKDITHSRSLTDAAWSPDGQRVATSADDVVKIWNSTDGTPVATMKHGDYVKGFAWHPDGSRLLAWDNSALRLWDARAGNLVKEYVRDSTFRATFTPDERNIVAIGGDHTAHVFAIDTGREVAQLLHPGDLYNVAVSPDGRYIAAIDSRNIVTIWLWRLDEVVAEARQRLTRNLTFEEWQAFFGREPYRKTIAERPVHPSVVYAALRRARDGDRDAFLAMTRRIETLEPALDWTPLKAEGQRVAAIGTGERAAREGAELIRSGKVDEGIASLRAAQSALADAQKLGPAADIPVEVWNRIAWLGALWGAAPDFLYSSDQAVAAAPSMPQLHDTRGVARALSGDVVGAIEDLEAFVNSEEAGELKPRRLRWLEALRKGENPFSREEIEYLRRE